MTRIPAPARIEVAPDVAEQLPFFDGFPYLTTRLVPTGFHLALLPAHRDVEQLLQVLRQQVAANQFDTALVLGPHESVFLSPGGELRQSRIVPRSTAVLSGFLLTPEPIDIADVGDRPARLQAFQTWMNRHGGFLFGDIGKRGHAATETDLVRLRGRRRNGVPQGLERCSACGEWRGDCLDRIPGMPRHWVVPVHCLCDNVTRCARCLQPLRERRLSGNEFNASDGRVWHWPGFMAHGHHCAESQRQKTKVGITGGDATTPT